MPLYLRGGFQNRYALSDVPDRCRVLDSGSFNFRLWWLELESVIMMGFVCGFQPTEWIAEEKVHFQDKAGYKYADSGNH